MEYNNNNLDNENKEQEIKEASENNNNVIFSESDEATDDTLVQDKCQTYPSNFYQDDAYSQNDVSQNDVSQNDVIQNDVIQNDVIQNDVNQNNVNQNNVNPNNTYQGNGYQGYTYQNAAYQQPLNQNTVQNTVPGHRRVKSGNNGFKKVLSYVLVGVVCATLGGAATTAGALYILPKTDAFKNTPLYKTIASNVGSYSNTTTTVNALPTVSTSGGLTVAQIAKKVAPAVVEVDVKTTAQSSYGSSNGGNYGWPFGSQGQGQGQQSQQTEEGVGSGIIYSKDGYILTNYHVVTADSSTIASSITVTFSNGKTSAAKVVNFDSTEDLAVLKVTTDMEMPGVAELGDSGRLQVGDNVIAIGNPLGKDLVGTVTSGIVSAVNRKVTIENKTLTLIQTDAAINAGNSGGPLVNSLGQVVGINSAKINETGVEGIGFSIPINTVKSELQGLEQTGLTLGIGAEDITTDEAKQYNVPQGILIDTVDTLSAAGKAGIQKNDIITEFDGQKVTTLAEINKIKFKHKTGDTIKVVVYRSNSNKYVTLSLTFIKS